MKYNAVKYSAEQGSQQKYNKTVFYAENPGPRMSGVWQTVWGPYSTLGPPHYSSGPYTNSGASTSGETHPGAITLSPVIAFLVLLSHWALIIFRDQSDISH